MLENEKERNEDGYQPKDSCKKEPEVVKRDVLPQRSFGDTGVFQGGVTGDHGEAGVVREAPKRSSRGSVSLIFLGALPSWFWLRGSVYKRCDEASFASSGREDVLARVTLVRRSSRIAIASWELLWSPSFKARRDSRCSDER
nr:hypothetical protein CFP56_53316 [Quercus suber]